MFILVIICYTGAIQAFVNGMVVSDGYLNKVTDESYFESRTFVQESEILIDDLTRLMGEFKNEEHIVKGGTISEDDMRMMEENLYYQSFQPSTSYNPNLTEEENFQKFKQEYTEEIAKARDEMIQNDIKEYHTLMQQIQEYDEPLFYASDGTNVFTNTNMTEKEQFANYPAHFLFANYQSEIFPKEWKENQYYGLTDKINEWDPKSTVLYVAFTDQFLDSNIKEWEETKAIATKHLYQLGGFFAGFILSFLYLILIIGRKSFKDEEVHLSFTDKIYTDVNLGLCAGLIALWVILFETVFKRMDQMLIFITFPIATVGLLLVLSLVKHIKKKTIFTHSLIYHLIYPFVLFVKKVYESGSVGVKTILIVVGYPLLVALTFFMFPITIGVAAWFAFKKVQSFQVIQDGVKKIKDGALHHRIEVDGNGEFSKLAFNINSISDGLEKAVESELKSERLKTELITNVSHDIRTPLTSIITYVDLLKQETNPEKAAEYIEVLEQKSQRLKVLTDDLFEAAKASSGTMPVQLEDIDIVSLLTQGLGEVNDKIEASQLDIKLQYPKHRVLVKADGKLLWRSIENLLSNIFKYALTGSRVYIDIQDLGEEIMVTFKNISANELNIPVEELMERFKRGDESRSSQGSGLGLSIAESLIELQKGTFKIQIDGDLFKAIITLPKA